MRRPDDSSADAWDILKRLYAKSPRFAPMLELISRLENSQYARGVYVWNSMWDLCIAQPPIAQPFADSGPFLRISLLSNGQLEFRYMDTRQKPKQWTRHVDAADGFRRLEIFFDQLHWFADTSPASVSSTV